MTGSGTTHSGFLLVDKPAGCSSAQVVGGLKHRLRVDRIGHAGTLDPMATGLLVVVIGRATKLAHLCESGRKRYSGRIQFGLITSTDDIEGEVLERSDVRPDLDQLQAALARFCGEIQQVPPAISALKIDGEPAYRRARRGETVVLAPRSVTIFSFVINSYDGNEASFTVECSKGTYVRSLARDLAQACGALGCLSALRREASAPFEVADAIAFDAVSAGDIRSWEALAADEPEILLSVREAAFIDHGDPRAIAELHLRAAASGGVRAVRVSVEGVGASGVLLHRDGGWRYCRMLSGSLDAGNVPHDEVAASVAENVQSTFEG